LKHYAVGAPLYKMFKALAGGSVNGSPVKVNKSKEAYWIIPAEDKVIVTHGMCFADDEDRLIAKHILDGFNFHKSKISGAPGVVFTPEPPSSLPSGEAQDTVTDWLTVQYFDTHVTPAKIQNTVHQAQNMRTFVAYHTKAAKANMNAFQRVRKDAYSTVLQRAEKKNKNKIVTLGTTGKILEEPKKKKT